MDAIQKNKQLVEQHLAHLLPANSTLSEAMRYSVLTPGKRIRPLLLLTIGETLGTPPHNLLDLACAIELIHAASLIIDDLPCMDDDAMRRDQSTTHKKYGEAVAILAAISLLTRSYDLVAACNGLAAAAQLAIVRLLSETVGPDGLSLGQHADLQADGAPHVMDVSDIHHLKTGVLFLTAAKSACLACQADAETTQHLTAYTFHLGLAFQIMDDIKDAQRQETNLVQIAGAAAATAKLQRHLQQARDAAQQVNNNVPLLAFIARFFYVDSEALVQSA